MVTLLVQLYIIYHMYQKLREAYIDVNGLIRHRYWKPASSHTCQRMWDRFTVWLGARASEHVLCHIYSFWSASKGSLPRNVIGWKCIISVKSSSWATRAEKNTLFKFQISKRSFASYHVWLTVHVTSCRFKALWLIIWFYLLRSVPQRTWLQLN